MVLLFTRYQRKIEAPRRTWGNDVFLNTLESIILRELNVCFQAGVGLIVAINDSGHELIIEELTPGSAASEIACNVVRHKMPFNN